MEAVEQDLMTDEEVSRYLRISLVTLRKYLKVKSSRIYKMKPSKVGGHRRWNRSSVMKLTS